MEVVSKHEIHLAIVDIMMPVMDGITMTMKLRQKYDFPIIFLSAKSEDIDKIKEVLFSLSKTISKFPIHFKTYNFYPNEKPFISIDMAAAKQILDLQTKIRSECDRYGELFGFDVFNEGIWKPDCQLTIEISKEKLLKAIAILLDTELPFNGTLERIGVIEFHPAKQLFSFDLQ